MTEGLEQVDVVLGLRTARGAGKHPSGKKSQNSTFGEEKNDTNK